LVNDAKNAVDWAAEATASIAWSTGIERRSLPTSTSGRASR